MTSRGLLRAGVVVGSLLTCAPLLCLVGTVLGMHHAVHVLGAEGISDPQALSATVARILWLTAGGLAICPCGVVLLIVCVLSLKRLRASQPPPLPRFPEA